MARTVGIGIQDFEKIIENECFYVDKTDFIREWWERKDDVTLITRPRRFGKTLNMSMVERFFSNKHAGKGEVFEGLSIWKHEEYRKLQGTYPVISLSFANIKEKDYKTTREKICQLLINLYAEYAFLKDSDALGERERDFFDRVTTGMGDVEATLALYQLSDFLYRYYGKKVIILLDEYDTPMQEAYVDGYWDELVAFTRSLFNATFKTNPWLERAIMTGITRVSKESIFSDLNNLKVVTTTSDEYATSFGFTEEEVFEVLEKYGLEREKEKVKKWYDGFIFGNHKGIYNPWSILNFLDTEKYTTYWANTSSNSLVGKLIREGSVRIKEKFEGLLCGESLITPIDEQIVYNQLNGNERAIWSLLLASGYLKVLSYESYAEIPEGTLPKYELALTNLEVKLMFQNMVRDWFSEAEADYNDFVKALICGDVKAMNAYMNRVALQIFSFFRKSDESKPSSLGLDDRLRVPYIGHDVWNRDTGNKASGEAPERFYHGFVLGLMVELQSRYVITSNRESGFGRYDVVMEPKNPKEDKGIILEFKVHDPEDEASLKDTVKEALRQIEEKKYDAILLAHGVAEENIRKYGFAFQGKKVLIG